MTGVRRVLFRSPSNIIAGMFAFTLREFFEIQDEKVKEVPTVQF